MAQPKAENKRELTRQELNALEPTVWVGKDGLTDEIIAEIKSQLDRKGYIKGKIQKSKCDEFDRILNQILEQTNSKLINKIGHTFIVRKKGE
ncbi:MAG: YhbY family RNA-binding protein [Candidatus Micrarchaeota archaeon]